MLRLRRGDIMQERRAFERWPIRCQVHCFARDFSFQAESFDVSEDGISFLTNTHLPVDSEAELQFRIAPDDPLIVARVLVRSQVGRRVGVQFLDFKHGNREFLRDHPSRPKAAGMP